MYPKSRAFSETRQAKYERALQQSDERFRRVVEAAPNAMVMTNAAGRIEMVNAQAERMFGYKRAELLGRPIEMLVPERFRGHHPELRAAFFQDPQSRPMGAERELFALGKDGNEFAVEIGLNPIETEDGTMVLSSIVDISERKHREDGIKAALREKELLLAEIHHRVKNNLQVISGLLDLQSSKITDATALQLLVESQNRIKAMSLIHQTLYESKDFARVDFGTFLDSLVPNLVSSYGATAGQVDLLIDTTQIFLPIDAAIPCGLIVNELISNALKHAFPDGRRGQIKIDLTHDENQDIFLSVGDDGIGIPADLDIENANTLGLQLVTLLTDQIGGTIAIQRANPTLFALQFRVER